MKKIGSVLVTGAAGAIGSATCKILSESNYFVIGMDKKNVTNLFVDEFVHMDLATYVSSPDLQLNLEKVLLDVGRQHSLVGLVNNAAVQILGGIGDLTIEDMRDSFDVNFMSAFLLAQLSVRLFPSSGGSIVNIGSIHSVLTKSNFLAYSTSKHALDGLTRSLAIELGEANIRVNLIMPAATNTEMLRDGFERNGLDLESLKTCHPLNRIAEPEEIGKAVKFLISSESSFISGASLRIDGGIGVRLHDPE